MMFQVKTLLCHFAFVYVPTDLKSACPGFGVGDREGKREGSWKRGRKNFLKYAIF